MSKLKVGDRVRVVFGCHEGKRGKIVVDDESDCRYIVRFEPPAPQTGDDSYAWATAADLRRLVKRKRPKPAAPDRVMVAAAVLGGLVDEKQRSLYVQAWGNERIRQTIADAFTIADALIAEGAK